MCRCQACTYSPESERVLNWESAHAQVECAHAPSKRTHAQVRRARAGAHDSEGRARVAGPDPACLRYTNGALSVIASVGR